MLPLDRYRLRLWFADGREREVDLTDRLWGPVLLPLRDPTLFAGVRIDEEFGTISWPGDITLDPDVLAGDEAAAAPTERY